MDAFLTYLETHDKGIMMLILLSVIFVIILRWLFQIFGIGKYSNRKAEKAQNNSITFILTRSLVNIVDDFRHFLALLIVILFVGLIIAAMWSGDNFDDRMEAMQLVIASLGGLLGSIIGYYYGESAARNKIGNNEVITSGNEEITNEAGAPTVEEDIIEPQITEPQVDDNE